MKWTIRQLREYPDEIIRINEVINVLPSLQERNNTIFNAGPVQVNGYFVPSENEVIFHGEIDVELTLPSTRSLDPVDVPLIIPIKERYVYEENEGNIDDYEETTIVLEHDYIDIEQAVIDLILLNLPVQVLTDKEKTGDLPSGNQWSVITEKDYEQKKAKEKSDTIDPRFEALKTLLDNEDEK